MDIVGILAPPAAWERWQAHRSGEEDGLRAQGAGVPQAWPAGTTLNTTAEKEIARKANRKREAVKARSERAVSRAKERLTATETRHTNAVRDRNEAKPQLKREREHFEKTRGEEPPEIVHSPLPFYLLLMLLLFLFELPVNFEAFQQLDEPVWLTAILTGGVALVLLVSAHSLGILVKEQTLARDGRGGQSGADPVAGARLRRLLIFLVLALPLAVISGVTYWRYRFLGSVGPSLFFFALNILFFFVAAIGSFRVHDELRDRVLLLQRRVTHCEQACDDLSGKIVRLTERKKLLELDRDSQMLGAVHEGFAQLDRYRRAYEHRCGHSVTWGPYPKIG